MEIISELSKLFDSFEDNFSLSDDTYYAEELQFQEALEASLSISSSTNQPSTSSSSRLISCEICTEEKQKSDMFQIKGCPHSFCISCISKHVTYKLQENIFLISCPDQDCNNIIEPGSLSSIVPPGVRDRWEEAITESTILACQKIHCPYENCSEVLIDDSDDGIVTECECPRCHRLFCAKCEVSWHHGFDCEEFQKLDLNKKEKEKLKMLAIENKWKECPNCKVFVDKIDGCIHITCRCKFEFCYICGLIWNESHWNTCQE
ncbi:hypothetical protein DH2020_013447 [Rehmannia glutinosa]|uniref:RBR-type E3 ubiquitin transferase n=1 Tax=Rehmannia glutinosa TaxID=99300 RepID=A0ABR0X2A0_REHGL